MLLKTITTDIIFITGHHRWSTSDLSGVSNLVADGNITTVKYLELWDHKYKYNLADIDNAIKILKTVTEGVWIDLRCIPAISSEMWAELAVNVGDIKQLLLCGGVVGGGAEAVVGRLVSRVSSATLNNVKIVDFSCLADSLQIMQGEQGARCQKIECSESTATDNRDKIVALGHTLGWFVDDATNYIGSTPWIILSMDEPPKKLVRVIKLG